MQFPYAIMLVALASTVAIGSKGAMGACTDANRIHSYTVNSDFSFTWGYATNPPEFCARGTLKNVQGSNAWWAIGAGSSMVGSTPIPVIKSTNGVTIASYSVSSKTPSGVQPTNSYNFTDYGSSAIGTDLVGAWGRTSLSGPFADGVNKAVPIVWAYNKQSGIGTQHSDQGQLCVIGFTTTDDVKVGSCGAPLSGSAGTRANKASYSVLMLMLALIALATLS